MVSRLVGLGSLLVFALGLFPYSGLAQDKRKTHLIAVILDDSNSMSIDEDSVGGAPSTSAEGSDPKGSAAFAVAQLLRLAPEGTHFLVYTYASIRDAAEPTLLKRTLTGTNRANALQDFVRGIEHNSDALSRAGAHGHGAHPYAINETPCQRSIETALSNIEGNLSNWAGSGLNGAKPTDISVIFLTDGRCYDPSLADPKSQPDMSSLAGSFRSLANSRFYFIRFRTTQAAQSLVELALALGGAAPEVTDDNPLEALRVFGSILGRIQTDPNGGVVHASHVTRGHEPLDFGQAAKLDYVFAAPCSGVDFCGELSRTTAQGDETSPGCESQEWLWWEAEYYRDTKLSHRSVEDGTAQFCWYSGAVTAREVSVFNRTLQQVRQQSGARAGMLWVHAEYHFEPDIRLCAGQCGPSCGEVTLRKKDEWHTPDESSTLCVEGRVLAHPLGQPATYQTLQVAFAVNPQTSATLDGTGLSPVLQQGGTDVTGMSTEGYPSWTYTGGFSDTPCMSADGNERDPASFRFVLNQSKGLIDRETGSIEICRCVNADNDDFCKVEDCDDTSVGIGGVGQPCREELARPDSTRLCSGWEPGQISAQCAANWHRDVDGACCCKPVPPICPDEGDVCKVAPGKESPCLVCQGSEGELELCSCCDGVDSDCDTWVDEGYPNYDGDSMADCVDADDDNDQIPDVDDCEPRNEKVHPGAPELCNGVDDDCDKQVDNVADGVECEVPGKKGACRKGKKKCQEGGWECVGPDPLKEECLDKVDNDCDGFVDEGCDYDCDGIQDLNPAEKDRDQDGCEDGDDPTAKTDWRPGPTPLTCSEDEIKKAGSIPRPQQDCRCSGWRWSLGQLPEGEAAACVYDKQSNVWKLNFGVLSSQAGAKNLCWVDPDPDKTCFRVLRADGRKTDEGHGFKPYLLKPSESTWKSQADNAMFEFPTLETSTPWIGPLDDFQELAIRLKPALDMKALPEAAPAEPFKFALDVQLAGRDVVPAEFLDKTATVPLRIEGEYTAYLGLVPGGGKGTALDISLPSGEEASTPDSAMMEITGQLPGKTALDPGSHFGYEALAARLCDFGDCEDEDLEDRPRLVFAECSANSMDDDRSVPLELAGNNQQFSHRLCLSAVGLDECKGHPFSFGCAETARGGETFTVALDGLTVDGTEVAVTRSVPVVLTVQRTGWDWFWAYLVKWWFPAIAALLLLIYFCHCWWNRRKNCFRLGQRVIARKVMAAEFDGDSGVRRLVLSSADRGGPGHRKPIRLDRRRPGRGLVRGDGWYSGLLNKSDEYFLRVSRGNSPFVMGVVPDNSPLGGNRKIKYDPLFRTYPSQREADRRLGLDLPARIQWSRKDLSGHGFSEPARPLSPEQSKLVFVVRDQGSWSRRTGQLTRSIKSRRTSARLYMWVPDMVLDHSCPTRYVLWEFVFVNSEKQYQAWKARSQKDGSLSGQSGHERLRELRGGQARSAKLEKLIKRKEKRGPERA